MGKLLSNEEIDELHKWLIKITDSIAVKEGLLVKDLFKQSKLANKQESIIERAWPYLQHERECFLIGSAGGENRPCNCGLNEILSDIKALNEK